MIVLRSPAEIAKIRSAAAIVAETLLALKEAVTPGMTTQDLDRLAEESLRRAGAASAFKGYRGYPAVLCVSINSEVVHGIPSPKRVLREGDIVGLDWAIVDGYYGDSAITVGVGRVDPEAERLMRVTREALEKGIEQARPGNRLVDISGAVQDHAESHGYSIVREFVGHGIGTRLHEEPQVPNYRMSGAYSRIRIVEGLVLAIEPMVNVGGPEVRVLEDGWTAVTKDGSLSAHFEHTLAVTAQGPLVLSRV